MIASGLLGAELDLAEVRRRHPVSARGSNVREIMEIAAALDMSGRAVRCELEELGDLMLPAILHWRLSHFVVVEAVRGSHVVVIDPARGRRKLHLRELETAFTGIAIELQRTPQFRKRKERSALKLTSLVRFTPSIRRGLLQALLLSLLMQAYVIASPLYMRFAIDEAALKGDRGLLVALALGFGAFALFNVIAEGLRGLALQKVSALMSWDMTGRLFHHMLRLPLPWFQRRQLADSLARFESIEPVRNLFANGLVSSLIDGALALTTLMMMFVFAWQLGLIVLVSLFIYVTIRLLSLPTSIRLAGDALIASIAEQGKRLETIRAMQTIKVMGGETQRESDWANRFAEMIRTSQVNAGASLAFGSMRSLTDAVANVAIIYLGAVAIVDNRMTVGMLYAFMSYKGQFLARSQGLFEQLVNWRMMDLHSDRIADIALTPVEAGIYDAGTGLHGMQGTIEIRNLGFRYSPQEPWIFQHLNARIEAGEFVAVVGPSGAGKSTLVKVLAGLYPATTGEIYFDGVPSTAWGPRNLRRNLGAVLQDDELIAGTIAENVSFFDESADLDRVWECLALAAIDEEIRSMPMRADTLIGDAGSALSGGQKQRILLARALYRQPRLLLLDEATSHLDVARERAINDALKRETATRIIVAHRQETIASADRVLVLKDGGLTVAPRAPEAVKLAR